MNYSAQASGSPLVPWDIIAAAVLAILALLTALYLALHLGLKASPTACKIRLFAIITTAIFAVFSISAAAFAYYWLIPAPHIVRTDPAPGETAYPTGRKIEIVFDRPISRAVLAKAITPEIPGVWVFENSTYRTHLMRRAVFYPQENLRPNTEYAVNLKNITNTLRRSAPFNFELKFKTQNSPTVTRVDPGNNANNVMVADPIAVYLSAPDGAISQFEFILEPRVDFNLVLDQTKTRYTLIPKAQLSQGTRYRLMITKSDIRRDLKTGAIVETSRREQIYAGYFTTKTPAGIDSLSPTGAAISVSTPITIRFAKEMTAESVLANFNLDPPAAGSGLLIDQVIFVYTPKKLEFDTRYTYKLAQGAQALDGSFLDADLVGSFTTLGEVKIADSFPKDGAVGLTIDTPITLTFDQDVDQQSVERRFALTPATAGNFSWTGRTLTFTPASPWRKDTDYRLTLKAGLKSREGLDSVSDYSLGFSTVQSVFKLAVPIYLQQHPLSCELAALRMALAFKEISQTEEELLTQVGYDPSPRRGNIWGNPYEAFVGNIDGKQMTTGYGVYWPPIARAAANHRSARDFSGASLKQILTEVQSGNPVIIWTYSKSGQSTFWFTPANEKIFAAAGEHTVVVVGFVGPVDNPSQIIINDPLFGQLYWSVGEFTARTAVFANSGVIIY